jgi:nicotinate-nucleotide adenylyltransferase
VEIALKERKLGAVRWGVLGGTFNPIHSGHLHIARCAQQLFGLSKIYFVVATTPPHKSRDGLIPFIHRYAMVTLATAKAPAYIPSMIELEPEASPFSVDTMDKLSDRIAPEKGKLYFIAGGDSLLEVKSWRESERLLRTYNFIFAMRPGTGKIEPENVLPGKAAGRVIDLTGLGTARAKRRIAGGNAEENRIYLVDVHAPDISATRIRGLISSEKPVARLVPGPVREYIRKFHLYGER